MSCLRILYRQVFPNVFRNLNLKSSLLSESAAIPTCARVALRQSSVSLARYFHSTVKIPGTLVTDGEIRQRSNLKHPVGALGFRRKLRDEISETLTSTELLDLYKKYSGNVTASDYVRILIRLAKFRNQGSRFQKSNPTATNALDQLLEDIKSSCLELRQFEVADVVWCLAKLDVSRDSFDYFSTLLEEMDMAEFSNIDIAKVLWAHGKVAKVSPELFNYAKNEILSRGVENFGIRELCQIVWALARTLTTSAKFLAVVKEDILKRDLTAFNKQDLLMLMWAYSEIGVNVKPLFRYFKHEILKKDRLSTFTAKDLSQVVWTFANQDIKAPDLFLKIERECLIRPVVDFDEQGLVVVAWAFAHTENASPRLFKFLESKLLMTNLKTCTLHQLSRLLWAFVKAGYLTDQLLQKLSLAMMSHDFAEFPVSALEEIVGAMQDTSLKVPPTLVAAMEVELVKRANRKY